MSRGDDLVILSREDGEGPDALHEARTDTGPSPSTRFRMTAGHPASSRSAEARHEQRGDGADLQSFAFETPGIRMAVGRCERGEESRGLQSLQRVAGEDAVRRHRGDAARARVAVRARG